MLRPLDPTLPTALLIIDSQVGFDDPTHWGTQSSNPAYKPNVTSLLSSFRSARTQNQTQKQNQNTIHILHVAHSSPHPSSPLHPSHPSGGHAFHPFTTPLPDEPVLFKSVNSAFIGTSLETELRSLGIKQLVIAGLTTDHCVSTSVRMAANLGVVGAHGYGGGEGESESEGQGRIVLVEDATATYGKGGYDGVTVHAVAVESLRGEFCEVWGVEEIVREMGRFG